MPSLVRKPGVHGRSASGTFFDCGGAGGGEEESFFVAASGLLLAEDGVEEEEDEDDGVIGGLEIPAEGQSQMKAKHPMDFIVNPLLRKSLHCRVCILMFLGIKEFSYPVVVSATQPLALGRNVVKIVGGAEVAILKYMSNERIGLYLGSSVLNILNM